MVTVLSILNRHCAYNTQGYHIKCYLLGSLINEKFLISKVRNNFAQVLAFLMLIFKNIT